MTTDSRAWQRGRPAATYLDELREYVDCVKRSGSPLVGLDDGVVMLRVFDAIREAMQTTRVVRV